MKAKFVNEKFSEKTDPIQDMGIGGIKLYDLSRPFYKDVNTHERRKEAHEKWSEYLNNLIKGKTIRAMSQRYPSMITKMRTLKVKNVIKSEYEYYYVKGEDGGSYRIDPDEKMYILE